MSETQSLFKSSKCTHSMTYIGCSPPNSMKESTNDFTSVCFLSLKMKFPKAHCGKKTCQGIKKLLVLGMKIIKYKVVFLILIIMIHCGKKTC